MPEAVSKIFTEMDEWVVPSMGHSGKEDFREKEGNLRRRGGRACRARPEAVGQWEAVSGHRSGLRVHFEDQKLSKGRGRLELHFLEGRYF